MKCLCAQVHTLIRKSFGGMESEPMLTPRGKIPSIGKKKSPQRRIEPTTLYQAGQRAQTHYQRAIPAPIVVLLSTRRWRYVAWTLSPLGTLDLWGVEEWGAGGGGGEGGGGYVPSKVRFLRVFCLLVFVYGFPRLPTCCTVLVSGVYRVVSPHPHPHPPLHPPTPHPTSSAYFFLSVCLLVSCVVLCTPTRVCFVLDNGAGFSLYCVARCFRAAQVLLLFVCLTPQQHASVSPGRIYTDNFTCSHTEIEVAGKKTVHLNQSQYTDTGPTSPSADPITPGAWQGSHWSASFWVTGMTRPRKKSRLQRDSNPGSSSRP